MPSFPDRGRAIIQQLYEARRDLQPNVDADQRLLTRLMAEQFAFEFGPRWGVKAASVDRPQGPSELAWLEPPLWIWRWSDGDGHVTGTPGAPLPDPLLMPLEQTRGQFFISVDPVDHLHVSETRPPRPPDPIPASAPVVDLTAILARLDTLERTVTALATKIDNIQHATEMAVEHLQDHRSLPRYIATVFGIKIVSVPEGS